MFWQTKLLVLEQSFRSRLGEIKAPKIVGHNTTAIKLTIQPRLQNEGKPFLDKKMKEGTSIFQQQKKQHIFGLINHIYKKQVVQWLKILKSEIICFMI